MRRAVVLCLLLWAALPATRAAGLSGDNCSGPAVTCGAAADPGAGDFHGLVAATDASWVLGTAARSGTTAGCGDCVWRVALACPTSSPSAPDPTGCGGDPDPLACPTGQLLYRLYLSDADVTDEVVGELCLGGPSHLVGIGDQARADVARYLGDATPPRLTITVRPDGLTLAGLPTRFRLSRADGLRPTDFGGPEVTEAITLQVESTCWRWGDGTTSDWRAGSPPATHRYVGAGTVRIGLAVRWGATYVVHYDGQEFGPYDATGQLTADQTRTERVATSSPVLVSD